MSITTILTGYRRPHILPLQIKSILNQDEKSEIWLWRNYHEDWEHTKVLASISKYIDITNIKIIDSNYNWKYLGRFALAMLARTEFVALFDDDTIPGKKWYTNCLETYSKTPGILGGVGILQDNSISYMQHTRVGWPSNNEVTTQVDLVGHAWFVNKRHLKYIWEEEPVSYDTAEDMHLSYTAQKYGGIHTYVPPHPKTNKELHSSTMPNLGVDLKTESVTGHKSFFILRDKCLSEYVNKGWKLVNVK